MDVGILSSSQLLTQLGPLDFSFLTPRLVEEPVRCQSPEGSASALLVDASPSRGQQDIQGEAIRTDRGCYSIAQLQDEPVPVLNGAAVSVCPGIDVGVEELVRHYLVSEGCVTEPGQSEAHSNRSRH